MLQPFDNVYILLIIEERSGIIHCKTLLNMIFYVFFQNTALQKQEALPTNRGGRRS